MAAVDFIAGCLGGCTGLLVGHPFDTIKVHMQTQDVKNPQNRGAFDCLQKLVKKDSVRGLYRGMSSPMLGVSAINAIVFGVYGNVQRMSSNPESLMSHFLAGSVAGFAQSIICSPMELAKTRLQVQTDKIGATKFSGPTQCLSYIYRCEGIRGVFRGLGATALRDIPGFSLYFVSYESLMRLKKEPGIGYTLFAGGTAGAFSWVLTIPIDVVKSRLQTDGMNGGNRMYSGMVDCFRKSYESEGTAFLTRGLSSTLLRAFPMNAICFLVVSMTIKHYEKNFGENALQQKSNQSQIESVSQKEVLNDCSIHSEREHKRRTLQGFLHIGTSFSDAICSLEIIETAHELFENNKLHFSNYRVNFSPNYEKYLNHIES